MDQTGMTFVWIGLMFGAWWFPYFVALGRHHHNRGAIGVLNLFTGWTAIGWIIALVWACTAVHRAPKAVDASPQPAMPPAYRDLSQIKTVVTRG
jgi:Superinfection immunity protein